MPRFSLRRTLKLGSFHIGSALADLLVTGVWNRVLISNLGIAAGPVALLAALRFLLAPLTIWVGHRSDTQPLLGRQRLSYIYLGRGLLWLSLPLLPVVLHHLGRDPASALGWGLALAIFLLYGLGTLVSGSPFLALVRESAPPAKQGLAVVVVQTTLLFGFAVVPIAYALLMPTYTLAAFWRLVLIAMVGCALTWFFSVWGEERTGRAATPAGEAPPFRAIMAQMWGQPNTRAFFGVLALGAVAMFAQDAILEPFGGDLFGLDVGATTRFNAYYGTGVLLAMIGGSVGTRRWLPQQFTGLAAVGLLALAGTLALLALAALARIEALLVPTLFAFGVASGLYTVGGLSLMVAMTEEAHAGAYLGLWSMVQLLFRGIGIALGGALVDVGRLLGSQPLGYASVFLMEALAALLALAMLRAVQQRGGYLFTPAPAPSDSRLAPAD